MTVGFRTVIMMERGTESCRIRLTASSIYRLKVNGAFVGHGPARGPHGFFRVDEWDLTDKLATGFNIVSVEVAGYNANSYYLLNQPSFLQAELTVNDSIAAATSVKRADFQAFVLTERLQKVQRYSYQRTFVEYYRLTATSSNWQTQPDPNRTPALLEETASLNYLARGVSYPEFKRRAPDLIARSGTFAQGIRREQYWRDRSLTAIGPLLAGYKEEELERIISYDMEETETLETYEQMTPYIGTERLTLRRGQFYIVDFGVNTSGFIGCHVICRARVKLFIAFDEILTDGDIDFLRLSCVNVIGFELEAGSYHLESIEPYTLKYAKLLVMDGEANIADVCIREFKNPDTHAAAFHCSDPALNAIFQAGAETFNQNALDLYMDCPSRERAGWLCDSYFMSKVEYVLSGTSRVETNFRENLIITGDFPFLPSGMIPMCYPADHYNGRFIPNWALWYVVELEQFDTRTNNRNLIAKSEAQVMKLLDYFRKFQNEYGLLENLESWVFVEWSKANELVQDVNFPTNMLYAGALDAAGRLYDNPELRNQASRLRETIRRFSFDGRFFNDNAVRVDGELKLTGEKTEVCQYYAFTFDIANPESHPELWRILADRFGPRRAERGDFLEVAPANAFIGNYLRLDLFSRYGEGIKLLDELSGYFSHMAEATGTLWENIDVRASCNHGFASYVTYWLYKEALGIRSIDHRNKHAIVQFSNVDLEWCQGSLPCGNGIMELSWRKVGQSVAYEIGGNHDYTVEVLPYPD
ncbi:hypothetical protein PAT3040_00460 [Paenibacillus agaridevorans]|uniref:Alpha-L-rhamnosidase six-hairpin glycosidase domain-containing protein n=1 Tax=Paenibacillus agaridevorans TaxID=171404 RepID=A0A2R5ERE6_9BACL|nr:hypothetical protein PAT3040_00460 [Paenibacillus agaridevorans]